jgi:hypothetical protein
VCNADAPDHHRVAKDGWHAGEVAEESNSGAKRNRHDVDVNVVEDVAVERMDMIATTSAIAMFFCRGVETAFRRSRAVLPDRPPADRISDWDEKASSQVIPRYPCGSSITTGSKPNPLRSWPCLR